MPKSYESGRESSLLADIKAGTKTIEARLDRGKFAKYKPGDQVWLREDFYENGKEVRSVPRQVLIEIEKIEKYPDFASMLTAVGYKNVNPRTKTLQEAVSQCAQFYTPEQEKQFGVLAIYFEVIKVNPE